MDWAIETRNLTKRFDRKIAVDSVDLTIAAGQVYGLIGPNGAGKTTLIRMLAAVEEPTIGEILIGGDRLDNRDRRTKLKRYIGFLPDDFPVYDNLNVWDYLSPGFLIATDRAIQAVLNHQPKHEDQAIGIGEIRLNPIKSDRLSTLKSDSRREG